MTTTNRQLALGFLCVSQYIFTSIRIQEYFILAFYTIVIDLVLLNYDDYYFYQLLPKKLPSLSHNKYTKFKNLRTCLCTVNAIGMYIINILY